MKGEEREEFVQILTVIRQPPQFYFAMRQIFSTTERQVVRQRICLMTNIAVSLTLALKTKGSHLFHRVKFINMKLVRFHYRELPPTQEQDGH